MFAAYGGKENLHFLKNVQASLTILLGSLILRTYGSSILFQ